MSLLAIGIGIGTGSAVFAAIPHTVTKEISACRDDIDGALRVIDAQANETCDTGEAGLSWSGAQTAIATFDYDDTDPMGPGMYSSSKSRNVAAQKVGSYDAGNGNSYGTGICLHLNFVPKFSNPVPTYSIYETDESGSEIVENACGAGYEYYAMNASRTSYFFSE